MWCTLILLLKNCASEFKFTLFAILLALAKHFHSISIKYFETLSFTSSCGMVICLPPLLACSLRSYRALGLDTHYNIYSYTYLHTYWGRVSVIPGGIQIFRSQGLNLILETMRDKTLKNDRKMKSEIGE